MRRKDVLGRLGEQLAAECLQIAGPRIWTGTTGAPAVRLTSAADRRDLVACEVKTRSGVRYGTPVEAVIPRKLRRLRRLAAIWASTRG